MVHSRFAAIFTMLKNLCPSLSLRLQPLSDPGQPAKKSRPLPMTGSFGAEKYRPRSYLSTCTSTQNRPYCELKVNSLLLYMLEKFTDGGLNKNKSRYRASGVFVTAVLPKLANFPDSSSGSSPILQQARNRSAKFLSAAAA